MTFSLEEIKAARDSGHSITSLVVMLEKKAAMFAQRRHWFIFKDGRNVCEFCGQLYSFADSGVYCNLEHFNL